MRQKTLIHALHPPSGADAGPLAVPERSGSPAKATGRTGWLAVAMIAAQTLALAAWAHHSHGNYQMTEYTELDGTVTEVYWINPHVWVYMEVVDEEGQSSVWAMEAAGATRLARGGIAPDELVAGDRIHVKCHPIRDGSDGCLLGFVTTADGVVKEWD